jgi:hypothetical protein
VIEVGRLVAGAHLDLVPEVERDCGTVEARAEVRAIVAGARDGGGPQSSNCRDRIGIGIDLSGRLAYNRSTALRGP